MTGFIPGAITDRVVALEAQLSALERRVEDNVKAALKERLAAIENGLTTIKARVADELKQELRHLMLNIALWAAAAMLAMIGGGFLLTSAWLTLMERFGATTACFALGVALLAGSAIPVIVLRSVVNRRAVAR